MKTRPYIILDFGTNLGKELEDSVRLWGGRPLLLPSDTPVEKLRREKPLGIIFSGGDNILGAPDCHTCDPTVFNLGVPVLAICFGMQYLCHTLGGRVEKAETGESGQVLFEGWPLNPLFRDIPQPHPVAMSHSYEVTALPKSFTTLGSTEHCINAAAWDPVKRFYAIQFHPELEDSPYGELIFRNFMEICR